MTNTKYFGLVIDRCGDNNHRTRANPTWDAAHHAAETLAKRLGLYHDDNYAIDVDDVTEL